MKTRFFFALLILLASLSCVPAKATEISVTGSPLAQLTPIFGTRIFFDPVRITAVVALPTYQARIDASLQRLSPQIFFPLPSALATDKGPNKEPVSQVLGIFANLMPVKEMVDDVVALAGRTQLFSSPSSPATRCG
ncbi:hypothetical protein NB311A_13266 [Nitrobacter sp. Nb-311A]|uniref:hypothetical protein n=1 Tax=Nitrobacter sp. Nb-311A TaxID=314253 RepID=UPI00006849A9|nr:hypothetical protein [Nitrobacter sp. Nb-311A]EAQ35288.1 hypothetical protein NB311A_13266 [Nitrobacter sp. Nb-311A]